MNVEMSSLVDQSMTSSSNLYICSKLDSLTNKSMVKLEMNLDDDVDSLSQLVAKQLQLTNNDFDLMCFGRILTSSNPLKSYGIKANTIVYVLNKITHLEANSSPKREPSDEGKPDETNKSKTSQGEIQAMVIALRTALMNPMFRNMLDKLNEADVRENLMAVTPGLREDPMTIAILQDPDLLSVLTDPSNIHKVLEKHPCLSEAATNLAAAFHEENLSNASSSMSHLGSRSHASYSLDAMSDEDEDDMSQHNAINQHVTAQRIAGMMVSAFQNAQTSQSGHAGTSGSSSGITREMLSQALMFNTPTPQQTTPSTQASTSSAIRPRRNWSTQLQQMRDLGITDEATAIQALEVSNGDVQEAVNLIFTGFNG